MKTMMTKSGLRFTVHDGINQIGGEPRLILSAQVTPGGTFYQWLLTSYDAAELRAMLAPPPAPKTRREKLYSRPAK